MVFPSSSNSCRMTLWSKIDAQGCRVGKILVVFNSRTLIYVLGISCNGFANCQKNKWPDLPPPLKSLDIVQKFLGNPSWTSESKERRDVASYLDLKLMEFLDRELPMNFLGLMVFAKLDVWFTALEYYSSYNVLDYFHTRGTHSAGGLGEATDVVGSSQSQESLAVKTLLEENDKLRLEIEQLKD
ncbi:hypothetical protein HAX54_033936 [Datura stramonium]|uniref:Uncharacterized protein n=1 Tax=Datura stramonium TaxID=4076 RepID=A0ABS8VD63_DATST|nr:hypothetical protein [Datura stramonium]